MLVVPRPLRTNQDNRRPADKVPRQTKSAGAESRFRYGQPDFIGPAVAVISSVKKARRWTTGQSREEERRERVRLIAS